MCVGLHSVILKINLTCVWLHMIKTKNVFFKDRKTLCTHHTIAIYVRAPLALDNKEVVTLLALREKKLLSTGARRSGGVICVVCGSTARERAIKSFLLISFFASESSDAKAQTIISCVRYACKQWRRIINSAPISHSHRLSSLRGFLKRWVTSWALKEKDWFFSAYVIELFVHFLVMDRCGRWCNNRARTERWKKFVSIFHSRRTISKDNRNIFLCVLPSNASL